MSKYGCAPIRLGRFNFNLPEVMYYLYLPVRIDDSRIALPPNVEVCRPIIEEALANAPRRYRYVYLSARKGWASPDNPLNRPGWHCDGFGTNDMNYVWWAGPGTRFAVQEFHDISEDHIVSQRQFEQQVESQWDAAWPERNLYALDPYVVHATPLIDAPGCMRQFVKISLSDRRYNLENNSHNYLLNYDWPLHSRDVIRNDTHRAQLDYV
jgi:hypothetical protein